MTGVGTSEGEPATLSAAARVDELVERLRGARGFSVAEVAAAKLGRLDGWFAAQGLDAAVVGVSGGVDSALVLALLAAAMRRPGSSLRRVVALLLPIDAPGATGQTGATRRGRLVVQALGAEAWEVPLGAAQSEVVAALEAGSGLAVDPWAAGQLLSVQRTPALYGAAALLQSAGHRSVVVGTTNRDEGAYLGFFGKASDAMVDLQPISDLHKSEVVALARHLGVPEEVCAAAPSGDVWDGRTDVEMIGATYDDVELVLRLHELQRDPHAVAATLADGRRLAAAADAVGRLHDHNRHKFAVGSPAAHLDVMPRGVPDGWPSEVLSGRGESAPTAAHALWHPPPVELDPGSALPVAGALPTGTGARLGDDDVLSLTVAGVLTADDCARLLATFAIAPVLPVGVTGLSDGCGIGSWRATAFDADLAAQLWHRLAPVVPSVRFLHEHSHTDGQATDERAGHRTWRVVGLGPVLRFMRYEPGGHHLGHYDAAFDYDDGRRTLSSVVVFLTGDGDPTSGGALRFLADGQGALPTHERDHRDWDREAADDEVLLAIAPRAGSALLFDHRHAHDIERWAGPGDRVIIRADVVYEAVPDGRSL